MSRRPKKRIRRRLVELVGGPEDGRVAEVTPPWCESLVTDVKWALDIVPWEHWWHEEVPGSRRFVYQGTRPVPHWRRGA